MAVQALLKRVNIYAPRNSGTSSSSKGLISAVPFSDSTNLLKLKPVKAHNPLASSSDWTKVAGEIETWEFSPGEATETEQEEADEAPVLEPLAVEKGAGKAGPAAYEKLPGTGPKQAAKSPVLAVPGVQRTGVKTSLSALKQPTQGTAFLRVAAAAATQVVKRRPKPKATSPPVAKAAGKPRGVSKALKAKAQGSANKKHIVKNPFRAGGGITGSYGYKKVGP